MQLFVEFIFFSNPLTVYDYVTKSITLNENYQMVDRIGYKP